MPAHDWTRVESGIFHAFHLAWIGELQQALNAGLLPADHYALAEQITGGMGPDVLTLAIPHDEPTQLLNGTNGTNGTNGAHHPTSTGGIATAMSPPKVRITAEASRDPYLAKQRTLVLRHTSNHRIVAIIEIVSPGNKADKNSIRAFREKILTALRLGVHVLILDLFPPSTRDPNGLHGLIWDEFTLDPYTQPTESPLTLVAYRATPAPTAYIEPFAVGDNLNDMPLFLNPYEYIPIPLERTYQDAFAGVPAFYRNRLEAA